MDGDGAARVEWGTMEPSLLARMTPDSCGEFLAAADVRFQDGYDLYEAGRNTGAIYLWGYVAEMLLKSACFRFLGHDPNTEITASDRKTAIVLSRDENINWIGNHHFLLGWAELLVKYQLKLPQGNYATSNFSNDVLNNVKEIYQLWREHIRYHSTEASEMEAERVRTATEWLLIHSNSL